MGTVHLLEAARATPSVKAIVNITSDKCYENREWTWGYRENDRMGGYDPYSNSKGCAELVSAAYRSSFFNPAAYAQHGVALATVRAGNVIGGGDWAKDRLIPDLISAFERNAVVNIRNPNAIRPWQHVLEPLRGYLDVAEKLYRSGASCSNAWNFGPVDEDVRPVIWIVECMAELWGSQPKWHIDTNRQPHEANYLKLDISRAHAELGWTPALRLQEALKLIVEWARYRAARKDIRDLTLRQISAYQSLTTA
jgi:CDP-glucose 4,6-dehydratase